MSCVLVLAGIAAWLVLVVALNWVLMRRR